MTRDAPIRANSSAASAEAHPAWVLTWTGMRGKKSRRIRSRPRSATMTASGARGATWWRSEIASGRSVSVRRVFIARYNRTPRDRAWGRMRQRSSRLKFSARSRALNFPNPRYTASAPASTAAKYASGDPAGARSSGNAGREALGSGSRDGAGRHRGAEGRSSLRRAFRSSRGVSGRGRCRGTPRLGRTGAGPGGGFTSPGPLRTTGGFASRFPEEPFESLPGGFLLMFLPLRRDARLPAEPVAEVGPVLLKDPLG